MDRRVNTKQVVGSIFKELLDLNRESICLKEVYNIESKLDRELRKNNIAHTTMYYEEVYEITETYDEFILIEEEEIHINSTKLRQECNKNIIEDCFLSGMPTDIENVILNLVKELLKDER